MEHERTNAHHGLSHAKVDILGVQISAIDQAFALDQIDAWIANGCRDYVSVCTVHTIMECQNDPVMRAAVNGAGMATPDGMPLVWLADREVAWPVKRVYGPNLMLNACKRSLQTGHSHYLLGGAEEVPLLVADELKRRFPGIRIAGAYSPPFRDLSQQEEARLVEDINRANPDIIWVALGTPKQDLWMAEHRDKLNAPVMIAVGAAFNFIIGRVSQAPDWMQRNGLEWSYRLLQEPRRLWHRYLVYNPQFVMKVLAQEAGKRWGRT